MAIVWQLRTPDHSKRMRGRVQEQTLEKIKANRALTLFIEINTDKRRGSSHGSFLKPNLFIQKIFTEYLLCASLLNIGNILGNNMDNISAFVGA